MEQFTFKAFHIFVQFGTEGVLENVMKRMLYLLCYGMVGEGGGGSVFVADFSLYKNMV